MAALKGTSILHLIQKITQLIDFELYFILLLSYCFISFYYHYFFFYFTCIVHYLHSKYFSNMIFSRGAITGHRLSRKRKKNPRSKARWPTIIPNLTHSTRGSGHHDQD